ncbi:MAG TPA: EthD family reductase [Candidatus Binataceae bacterium]|nr:EthD family reductase [Candidatus Binataceae bacterium]
MQFTLAAFNYQSSDIEAEERNYLGHHVSLAKQLPGIRMYYTSRTMEHGGQKPSQFRYAFLGFDNAEASAKAFDSPAGPALMADTRAHLKDLKTILFEGEIIVPFDSRKPGQKCLLMAAEFNLDKNNLEAAEKRYREHHTGLARRLPGLRNYIIGKLPAGSDRYRIAVLAFDSLEAFKDAYRSPLGAELIKDEEATIHDARVYRLDARVEL